MQEYQIILKIKTRHQGKGIHCSIVSFAKRKEERKRDRKGEKEKENGEKSFCCPIVKKKFKL